MRALRGVMVVGVVWGCGIGCVLGASGALGAAAPPVVGGRDEGVGAAGRDGGRQIFQVASGARSVTAERAVVTWGEALSETQRDTTPACGMLGVLDGVVGVLDAKGMQKLRSAVERAIRASEVPPDARRVATVHLIAKTGSKPVELLDTARGGCYLREAPPGTVAVRLKRDEFFELVGPGGLGWTLGRGASGVLGPGEKPASGGPALERGKIVELEGPYSCGRIWFDKQTLGDRFLNGRRTSIEGAVRELEKLKFYARIPAGYSGEQPAGLLVWISASAEGRPPEMLGQALDELGIICIGAAESGNIRPVADRYQLAFDAMATAQERYHVDPRRVYVTGISGGGRVASMLWACFPEWIAGAVPVVGVSSYANVPVGLGRHVPAAYVKPGAARWALLRARRMVTITGSKDFNEPEIMMACQIMRDDGLQVKAIRHAGMGHQMPSAEQFAEALRWVDEPWRTAREKEETAAKGAWKAYVERWGERAPPGGLPPGQRQDLEKILEAGPWTDAAWRAARVLRPGLGRDEGK